MAVLEVEAPSVPAWVIEAWTEATYDEARTWFEWIQIFTPSDLASSMAVDVSVAMRFIRAGVWHGIIRDSGDIDFEEPIYEYVPLPPGPTHHFTRPPPEVVVGFSEVLCRRGMPIRIRTERDQRKTMSTPGARGRIKRREQRYKAMQEAVEMRRKKQMEKREDTRKVKPKRRREMNKEWWE